MATTTEENKDPFAGVREALYKQKPETREAEIRAQRNRAKATAFLQAFGSIADAFTLHQGGDVVKRDLNPYVMNNMQRADSMGEQDRADKRAWENSWLNLENGIAQYGVRQQELARQKAWRDEERKEQQAWQEKQTLLNHELGYDNYVRQLNAQYDFNEMGKDAQHQRNIELYGLKADKEKEIATQKYRQQIGLEAMRINGRKVVAAMRAANSSGGSSGKPFLSIINPDNPAEMIDIDESTANLLFAAALQARDMDDEIAELIPYKPNGKAYTRDEMKQAVELLAKTYPEKVLEYFGALAPSIIPQRRTTPAAATQSAVPNSPYAPGYEPTERNIKKSESKFK
jgi:hypothetical protein